MNILSKIIGRIANFFDEKRISYRENLINKQVKNNGGHISGRCTVVCPENIEIGDKSYVNSGYLIASKNAKIVIGNNCLLSYNIHLRTDMHNYLDDTMPINKQGHTEKNIIIKDDVWIGFGAQIMPGVTVEDGCIIGAGAVLTHSTEPYGVYVGVPARLIKTRTKDRG